MSRQRRLLISALCAVGLLSCAQAAAPPALLPRGSAAPDFAAKLTPRRTLRLSELRKGKVLLLSFAALSSDFCRLELQQLQRERERLSSAGLEVLAISSGKRDGLVQLQRYQEANALSFTILPAAISPEDPLRLYRVQTYPTTYLIGKDGKVLDAWVGYPPRTGAADLQRRLTEAGFKS